jgi:hypothetical protein
LVFGEAIRQREYSGYTINWDTSPDPDTQLSRAQPGVVARHASRLFFLNRDLAEHIYDTDEALLTF